MARIFVADDNADVRHVVTYSLMHLEHEIVMFRDGEAALEALLADPPELLILDIMMPGQDGFEVLTQLKSWGVQETTRTLVLSARVAEEDRERALRLGADLYISKPFDPEELAEAARALIALAPDDLRAWRALEHRDVAVLLDERSEWAALATHEGSADGARFEGAG